MHHSVIGPPIVEGLYPHNHSSDMTFAMRLINTVIDDPLLTRSSGFRDLLLTQGRDLECALDQKSTCTVLGDDIKLQMIMSLQAKHIPKYLFCLTCWHLILAPPNISWILCKADLIALSLVMIQKIFRFWLFRLSPQLLVQWPSYLHCRPGQNCHCLKREIATETTRDNLDNAYLPARKETTKNSQWIHSMILSVQQVLSCLPLVLKRGMFFWPCFLHCGKTWTCQCLALATESTNG